MLFVALVRADLNIYKTCTTTLQCIGSWQAMTGAKPTLYYSLEYKRYVCLLDYFGIKPTPNLLYGA